MSEKANLCYFNGRGKGEIVRLALCGANIQYDETLIADRDQFLTFMKENPEVLYQQLPVLQLDGKTFIQTGAIVRYIAKVYGMFGDSPEEEYRVDMMFEGSRDFLGPYMGFGWPEREPACRATLEGKLLDKYLSLYDKVLSESSSGFLVGNKLSLCDLGVLECLLATKDYYEKKLDSFPHVQAYMKKMSSLSTMAHYLKDCRKKPNDDQYMSEVKCALGRT